MRSYPFFYKQLHMDYRPTISNIFIYFLLVVGGLIMTGCDDDLILSDFGCEGDYGLQDRDIIERGHRELLAIPFPNQSETQISARIKLNREGLVIDVEIIPEQTSVIYPDCLTRGAVNQQIEEAYKAYRYAPKLDAPEEQCGILSFVFHSLDSFVGC